MTSAPGISHGTPGVALNPRKGVVGHLKRLLSLVYSWPHGMLTKLDFMEVMRMKRFAAFFVIMFALASASALACDGSGDKMKSDGKSGSQEKKT